MPKLKSAALLATLALVALPASSSAVELVGDGSFEGATGMPLNSPSWTEADSVFGSPLCNAGCGTGGGSMVPRTGANFAWFGGTGGTQTASLAQAVVIPPGTASLTFHFRRGTNMGGGVLSVLMDGNSLFTANDTSTLTNYTAITRDLGAYANGFSHTLRFDYVDTVGGAAFTNMAVDDVSINATPAPTPAGNTPSKTGTAGKCKRKGKKKQRAAAAKCKKKRKKKR
jgi:hypothetical protein